MPLANVVDGILDDCVAPGNSDLVCQLLGGEDVDVFGSTDYGCSDAEQDNGKLWGG